MDRTLGVVLMGPRVAVEITTAIAPLLTSPINQLLA
jgi:hypothetical protein